MPYQSLSWHCRQGWPVLACALILLCWHSFMQQHTERVGLNIHSDPLGAGHLMGTTHHGHRLHGTLDTGHWCHTKGVGSKMTGFHGSLAWLRILHGNVQVATFNHRCPPWAQGAQHLPLTFLVGHSPAPTRITWVEFSSTDRSSNAGQPKREKCSWHGPPHGMKN